MLVQVTGEQKLDPNIVLSTLSFAATAGTPAGEYAKCQKDSSSYPNPKHLQRLLLGGTGRLGLGTASPVVHADDATWPSYYYQGVVILLHFV